MAYHLTKNHSESELAVKRILSQVGQLGSALCLVRDVDRISLAPTKDMYEYAALASIGDDVYHDPTTAYESPTDP